MKAHWATVALAVFVVAGYCHAITWTDSFEFDSSGDYVSGTNTCYTETGSPAGGADGTSGTADVQLGNPDVPSGYLRIITAGGKRAYELDSAPIFSHTQGWTVEYRLRFDRSHDWQGAKAWQLRVRDGVQKQYASIANSDGPDIAILESEVGGDNSAASWTAAAGGTLIDATSDWHTYRMIYDPAKASNKTELWVDGTMVMEMDFINTAGGNQLKFGITKSAGASVEVWIDYIRWALDTVERPSGPGLATPALKNRFFDNIHDDNGPLTPGGNQVVPFWEIENLPNINGEVQPVEVVWETGAWRCESYGRALRLMQGQAYDAAVKQSVTCEANAKVTFKAAMTASSASCTPIEGRVGIDPTGACTPTSPSVIWGPWTSLYDDVNCVGIACQTLEVTASTGASPDVCVFIETKADYSPGNEQSTFIDSADLTWVPNCHAPPQDADGDGDVDLADFSVFQACFNGPNRPWPSLPNEAQCKCLDTEPAGGDGDIDLADFGVFQGCFNGPNRPPNC